MNAPKLSSTTLARAAALAATLTLGATLLPAAAVAAPSKTPSTSAGPSTPPPSAVGVVNLNTATAKQLAWLPGIGPSRAQRIVAFRTKHPFKKTLHLARVKGIGLKTLRKLRPYLTVHGATTLTGPIAGKRPAFRKRGTRKNAAAPKRHRKTPKVASER